MSEVDFEIWARQPFRLQTLRSSNRSGQHLVRDTMTEMTWLIATPLDTDRFILEPLTVDHASEMVEILAPPDLYTFIGGEPPTEELLRARYERQSVGHSPTQDVGWLNWIIRSKATDRVIGYVQATLSDSDGSLTADIAWLITTAAQHTGAATESASIVLTWLQTQHVRVIRAFIHSDHLASARVAERLGLTPTSTMVDGETVWELSTR